MDCTQLIAALAEYIEKNGNDYINDEIVVSIGSDEYRVCVFKV